MARDIVAELRRNAANGWFLLLQPDEVQYVVARLDALEAAEAELTELRASLETRSPED